MNAKISVFVICVEAIIYLLLYNLHDCTSNLKAVCLKLCLKETPRQVIFKDFANDLQFFLLLFSNSHVKRK